jgi:hypothetical protein
MHSSRELWPSKNRIFEIVCEFYNEAVYLARKSRRDTLNGIGRCFQFDNDSTVSSVNERMKKRLAGDQNMRIRLDKVEESILKSQERT